MRSSSALLRLLAPGALLLGACGSDDAPADTADLDAAAEVGGADTDAGTDAPDPDDAAADGRGASDAADAAADVPDDAPPLVPANELNGVLYEPPACADYGPYGPHVVGVTTLMLDEGDRQVGVEVFYPAEPGSEAGRARFAYDMREWLPEGDRAAIPDDAAPFFALNAWRELPPAEGLSSPVVLFAHGLSGYRLQSATLLAHLASWGFVVASADHPERGLAKIVAELIPGQDRSPATVRATLELLRGENDGSGLLAGTMDFDHVAMTGHSMGGGTTFAVAGDEVFDAFISYAAGGSSPDGGDPLARGLLVAGQTDGIVPVSRVRPAYDGLAAPRAYVELADAGHLAFSDLCAIGRDRGGILAIALEYGIDVNPLLLDLGSDGCREGDMTPEVAWPIIHHTTVAWLRYHLGLDAEPVGLGDDLVDCFGSLLSDSAAEP
jgi:predicted dienelactone hydrolase